MPQSSIYGIADTFEFPYGEVDKWTIWVRDETGTKTPREYNFSNRIRAHQELKELNKIWKFGIDVMRVTDADLDYLVRGNTVKIFFHDVLIFRGSIDDAILGSNRIMKLSGIGRVAYYLSNTPPRTTRTDYSNTAYSDITTAILSGSGVVAVTNVNYGNISERLELDSPMQLMINHVNAANYEWWESWGNNPYNWDEINIAVTKGSPSPVYTLQKTGSAGDNVISSVKQKEDKQMCNYVLALGYGDGDTQLQSICFHSTTVRTTLSAAATKTATTISLTDASGFPSSGNVWVGCEKITYSGKSTNDLTGCTRGVAFMANVAEAYEHEAGISVYDAQYTSDQAGAQAGSSIKTYGVMAKKAPSRNIVDQNWLDRAAQFVITVYKDPQNTIVVKPMASAALDILKSVSVGDYVTHEDTYSGIDSGNYRVVGIKSGRSQGSDTTELYLSRLPTSQSAVLEDMTINLSREASYTQGAPCYIPLHIFENADASNYGIIRVFVPAELTFIKSAMLKFILTDFRAYDNPTQTSSGGSSHSHGVTILSTGEHAHSLAECTAAWPTGGFPLTSGVGSTIAGGVHAHGGFTSDSEGAHTHGLTITFGITEEALTGPSVDIYMGEYGEAMTKVNTSAFTTANSMLTQDITTALKAVGNNKTAEIQFRCNKNMRIECSGYIIGQLKP